MNKISALLFLVVITAQSGCAQKKGKDYLVTIKTKYGDMVAILYDETPKHKANFIKLAQKHFYDSLLFHRVMKDFMIQGGDPTSKKAAPGQPLGMGEPGYTIEKEIVPKYFHEKGSLSAARLSDAQNPMKASSGSQFYIVQGKVFKQDEINQLQFDQNLLSQGLRQLFQNQNPDFKSLFDSLNQFQAERNMAALEKAVFKAAPRIEKATGLKIKKEISPEKIKAYTTAGGTPFLDNEYTVFGKVIKGLDVIDKIAALPGDGMNRPTEDVRMFISVEEVSKKKIEKEYGYKYPEEGSRK